MEAEAVSKVKTPSTITIRYVPQKDWFQVIIYVKGAPKGSPPLSRNYGSLETLLGFVRDHFGKEGA